MSEKKRFTIRDVRIKSRNQLVTYIDEEAEKEIVRKLKQVELGANFITEEGTEKTGSEYSYSWVIDPLDGTTNYIAGLTEYSVSIGLEKNGNPLLGVIYVPELDQMFYAAEGEGAFLNGQKIKVSGTDQLSQALIATGFPYYDFERIEQYLEVLSELMQETRGIRRLGSAAIDLAYTAAGYFDAFFEYGLNPWDVSAGFIIVREAGGMVINFQGTEAVSTDRELLAVNQGLLEKLMPKVHPLHINY